MDLSNPRVSIITAAFNRADFLGEMIASVQAQQFQKWELIIVDDASTDATYSVAQTYAHHDARIRVIKLEKNVGVSTVRMRALNEARGEYAAILDSDDVWLDPTKIDRQVAILDSQPTVVVVGTGLYRIVDGHIEKRAVLPPHDDASLRKIILRTNPLFHSSVMFRREAVLASGGYDTRLGFGEDYDLWLRLAKKSTIAVIPEPMLGYRVHQQSVTHGYGVRGAVAVWRIAYRYRRDYPHFLVACICNTVRIIRDFLRYLVARFM